MTEADLGRVAGGESWTGIVLSFLLPSLPLLAQWASPREPVEAGGLQYPFVRHMEAQACLLHVTPVPC